MRCRSLNNVFLNQCLITLGGRPLWAAMSRICSSPGELLMSKCARNIFSCSSVMRVRARFCEAAAFACKKRSPMLSFSFANSRIIYQVGLFALTGSAFNFIFFFAFRFLVMPLSEIMNDCMKSDKMRIFTYLQNVCLSDKSYFNLNVYIKCIKCMKCMNVFCIKIRSLVIIRLI